MTAEHRKKKKRERIKVCYYYCQDEETGETTSILSALILSLLVGLTGLKKSFVEWYKDFQNFGHLDPAIDSKILGELLCKVLEAIDHPVFVVIDGLDECNTESRNELLTTLHELSQRVSGLKILLSSSAQGKILKQLEDTAKIEMLADAHRDGIIVEKVVERKLLDLSPDVKSLVIDKLTRLAKGSAIWTRTTIELIEARKIREFEPMKSFLEEMSLPEQLSEIYNTLLSRCTSNDTENLSVASVALRLLVIANRDLSILELAWAVALSTTGPRVMVEHHRALELINPFIAYVEFKDMKKHQVRLVHHSVKEFVLKKFALPHGQISKEPDEIMLNQSIRGAGLRDNLDAVEYF